MSYVALKKFLFTEENFRCNLGTFFHFASSSLIEYLKGGVQRVVEREPLDGRGDKKGRKRQGV